MTTEPGAARRGNFVDYYRFNPAENRVKHIPRDLLAATISASPTAPSTDRKITCLDVGCNTGELTVQLMDHLAAGLPASPDRPRVSFHGVDFDETLIQRAKETSAGHVGGTLSFTAVDVMADGAEERLRALLGPGEERFDVAFCFSVSMWIHLNHGDVGLESFFGLLSRLSRFVVLEPQPWRCYQTAARRMRKLGQPEFEHMRLIGHRDKDLEPFILASCERAGLRVRGDFGTTNWKRKLLLLENASVVGNSK